MVPPGKRFVLVTVPAPHPRSAHCSNEKAKEEVVKQTMVKKHPRRSAAGTLVAERPLDPRDLDILRVKTLPKKNTQH
jgi:hypothetical protein